MTLRRSLLVAMAVAALAAPAPPASGQPESRQGPPRTAWGDPDLGGVWDFRTITPLERPANLREREFLTDEEASEFREQTLGRLDFDNRSGGARIDVERAYNNFWWDWGDSLTDDKRTSLIIDPPDGRIPPMTEEASQQARATRGRRPVRQTVVIGSKAHGPEDLGLSERCIIGFNAGPPMLPSAYNNNVQLFQTEDTVAILNEMIHHVRVVPLDGRPPLDEEIEQWLGSARGHWDGDTLVVDSTNFSDKTPSFQTLLGAMGTGRTLHLRERFTRIDSQTLLYEFTVDDPATFTAPFTGAIPMKRSDAPLYEYACHEGNYGMTNLLAGARAVERESAAKSP